MWEFDVWQMPVISIHSLRMEGDHCCWEDSLNILHFNPLPPHGGRRWSLIEDGAYREISIHSLRMEGDVSLSWLSLTIGQISIHSLRMEGDL